LIFHGAWSDRYLLASPTSRIASVMASFCRCFSISRPTVSNASRALRSSVSSASVRSPAGGIAPKFFAAIEIDRLTRLPQPATSSSLLRRRNSAQVKSVSVVSGPATAMK
jgi:hypothetical protein